MTDYETAKKMFKSFIVDDRQYDRYRLLIIKGEWGRMGFFFDEEGILVRCSSHY